MTQPLNQEARQARIRVINDHFRQTMLGGQVLMTNGIQRLPAPVQSQVFAQVQTFQDFTPDNDPYGEHDFGSVTVQGHKVFWKIAYYAPDMLHGSDDPADPAVTRRVLTIMLASEY